MSTRMPTRHAQSILPSEVRLRITRELIDEASCSAACEWVLRYVDPRGVTRQVLGGTTFEVDPATQHITHWRSYTDGGRQHLPIDTGLDFVDLDERLSTWKPSACAATWTAASLEQQRCRVYEVLEREVELWGRASQPMELVKPFFESVYAEDATLINPWTVELSRDSRWAGYQSFAAEYTDCSIEIHKVCMDHAQPGLFAVERTFTCTNKETGVRGSDEDWALGKSCCMRTNI